MDWEGGVSSTTTKGIRWGLFRRQDLDVDFFRVVAVEEERRTRPRDICRAHGDAEGAVEDIVAGGDDF